MSKETDIVEMIKSRRYFNLALKKLLSAPDRMKLKERSRYLCIDPEQADDKGEQDAYKLTKLCNIAQPNKQDIDHELYTDGFCSSSNDDVALDSDSQLELASDVPQPENFVDEPRH